VSARTPSCQPCEKCWHFREQEQAPHGWIQSAYCPDHGVPTWACTHDYNNAHCTHRDLPTERLNPSSKLKLPNFTTAALPSRQPLQHEWPAKDLYNCPKPKRVPEKVYYYYFLSGSFISSCAYNFVQQHELRTGKMLWLAWKRLDWIWVYLRFPNYVDIIASLCANDGVIKS